MVSCCRLAKTSNPVNAETVCAGGIIPLAELAVKKILDQFILWYPKGIGKFGRECKQSSLSEGQIICIEYSTEQFMLIILFWSQLPIGSCNLGSV